MKETKQRQQQQWQQTKLPNKSISKQKKKNRYEETHLFVYRTPHLFQPSILFLEFNHRSLCIVDIGCNRSIARTNYCSKRSGICCILHEPYFYHYYSLYCYYYYHYYYIICLSRHYYNYKFLNNTHNL